MRRMILLACGLLFCSTYCLADTIVSVDVPDPTLSALLAPDNVFYVHWTQSIPYNNVMITADLEYFPTAGPLSVHAYLTTQIGPGTTTADEVAHFDFTSTAFTSPETYQTITLFSGLNLGPDNYYLTLNSSSGAALWKGDRASDIPGPVVTTGAGVTSDGQVSFTNSLASYAPASPFVTTGLALYEEYAVTGTAVPEPSSLLLLGTGLGVIGLAAWRKRK